MANSFYEIQFPTDISYGSAGGPGFDNEILILGSGHEKRNRNVTYPQERWNVAYGVRSITDLQTLLNFFYVVEGNLIGFRFKNHIDYQIAGQEIGTGDGSEVDFQIIRTYAVGANTYDRKITKPVDGTVSVYVDTVELDASAYAVDYTTGIVTLDSAPTSGQSITADFEFDIPARFVSSDLPVNLAAYLAGSASVEVLEMKA